jgi:hypothetical protein
MSLPDRIEAKIDRSGDCHLWTGYVEKNGYGRAKFRGEMWLVHRLVYALEVGPIPPGMQIDHVRTRGCTSRACVNVAHLEAVTLTENALRARKTHCLRGHPYDEANTYVDPSTGYRRCRRCHADAERARWTARRAA